MDSTKASSAVQSVHGYFTLALMAFCVSLVTSTHLRGMAPDVQIYRCQGLHTEAFLLRASSQEVIFSKQLNKIWMLNRQGGVYVLASALCIHTYVHAGVHLWAHISSFVYKTQRWRRAGAKLCLQKKSPN